jgi:hypothetical protein
MRLVDIKTTQSLHRTFMGIFFSSGLGKLGKISMMRAASVVTATG